MITDKCVPLVASGAAGLTLLSAWHIKCTAAAVVNIRKNDGAGSIIVPLKMAVDSYAGEAYANPLQAGDWFLEVVSGTVVASLCGRA